jgi:hypothetical protein
VPETPLETPETDLANTTLSDRELLIHALQHLEWITEQLTPLIPLVKEIAPDGTLSLAGIMRAKMEARRGGRTAAAGGSRVY